MRRLRERLRGGADYQRVDVAAAELSGGEPEVEEFAATGVGRAGVVLMLANSTSADLIAHVRVRAHQIQK